MAVRNTVTKSKSGRNFSFNFQLREVREGEVKAGVNAEAVEESIGLLTCSTWFAQLAFYITWDHLPSGLSHTNR